MGQIVVPTLLPIVGVLHWSTFNEPMNPLDIHQRHLVGPMKSLDEHGRIFL